MNKRVKRYGFSTDVNETVTPIIRAIESGHVQTAVREIAELALDVCDKIEKRLLSAKKGDQYFLLLDLYIGDYCEGIELGEDCNNLIGEGNLLHDYGEEYGTDLASMRTLARKILQANQNEICED